MLLYMSKGAPILISRRVLQIVFGLLTFAVLARSLTKEQFAIYSLVFGYIAVLRLTTFPGLGSAIGQAFARGFQGEFRQAVKISLAGSLLGLVVLLCGAWWHYHTGRVETGRTLLIASFLFPFVTGLMFWRNAAVGSEYYMILLWFDTLSAGLKCGSVVVCAYLFPMNLTPVMIAALAAPASVNILATISQVKEIYVKNMACEKGTIKYGLWVTIFQIPSTIVQQLDKVVLFYFISPEALAIYAVALRIPELARGFTGEANATLGPLFAREKKYTRGIHQFSFKLFIFYLSLAVIGAIFVVPYLLPILAGSKYAASIRYAQFMTVGVALGFLGDIRFRYIKSHLHRKNYFIVTFSKALFDGLIIIGFAYYFGLAGIVAAYVLKNLVFSLITTLVIRFNYLNGQGAKIPLSLNKMA